MPSRRTALAAAGGLASLLLQGCLPKPPRHCTKEGFNCMDTGCCMQPGLKCFARDKVWASCEASCTPSFTSLCKEVKPSGLRPEHSAPTAAPAPSPPVEGDTPIPEDAVEWKTATWTTGYWDCCKPSCAWMDKGDVDFPVASCDAGTGERLEDPNVKSVCNGGTAATCTRQHPFVVHHNLSMGFAAAAVAGRNGLVGDRNCGQCFELLFTGRRHVDAATGDDWGGASPDLEGRRMIVQVTNIGNDVTGNHSFDIQVPGAGQGLFENGCRRQFPDYDTDDFDCGNRHGGCSNRTGCARLPHELRGGCEWHFDWLQWLKDGGRTNNPFVRFRRVRCPRRLTLISGSVPNDDADFPVATESADFYFA